MKKSRLLGAIYVCFFSLGMIVSVQPASAAIVSDFESGPQLDGWGPRSGNGSSDIFQVFDLFDPTNHALIIRNPQIMPYHNIVGGSPLFTGDLSAYDGGTLSFQVRFGLDIRREIAINAGLPFFEIPGGAGDYVIIGRSNSFFGEITLTTDVGTFVFPEIGDLDTPDFQWYTHTIPMTATAWGIDQATWSLGLQDVTDLQIDLGVDTLMPVSGYSMLDNVRLDAVPIPATVWLFGSGLLGLIGIARRRKSA